MSAAASRPHSRSLTADELREAFNAEVFADPQNLFVRNQIILELKRLAGDATVGITGDWHGSFDAHGMRCVALFARVGVLAVAGGDQEDALALCPTVLSTGAGFRLLIGERDFALDLLDRISTHASITMNRSQPFLVFERPTEPKPRDPRLRLAHEGDIRWLTQANLQLNEEDLDIAPATVHRRLLRQRIVERIAAKQSWVLEADGRPVCKLELGSRGPAGILLEGVFTRRDARGKGYAKQLVEQVCTHEIAADTVVGLHCNRDNAPAVAAYQAVGFREVADLRLACLRW